MERYRQLIADLGYPLAARISEKRIASFMGTDDAPPQWYGYPPVLMPLLSDGSLPSYLGAWKHWFVERRVGFVNLSVSDDHRADEVARTEEQLAEWLVARLIVAFDEVSDDVHALVDTLGVSSLNVIDAVTEATGDEPRGLAALPTFATQTPLHSCDPAAYDGEFAIPERADGKSRCSFDYNHDVVPTVPSVPDWLDPASNKADLFRRYFEQGDYGAAWLTLNGTGWQFSTAAQALAQLATAPTAEPEFVRMADIWIAHAANDPGGY